MTLLTLGPESYDRDLQYRRELHNTTTSLCCNSVILKAISYTCVQSVGPYNLTLSSEQTGRDEPSRESSHCGSGGKERMTW